MQNNVYIISLDIFYWNIYRTYNTFLISFDRGKRFDTAPRSRDENNRFSFSHKGINIGDEISFRDDSTITAKVVGDHEVEYMGYVYKLSPLTRKIMEELGRGNESGAYQGAAYWDYQGQRLAMMKDVN